MELLPLSLEKKQLIAAFASASGYAKEDIRLVASPYRISPLGAHIDHQGGPVLGMTIDAYTLLAYVPARDDRIRLRSLNYEGDVDFRLAHPDVNTGQFWGIYAAGAVSALGRKYSIDKGIHGLTMGHLPGGGLSSSASVLLAYLAALAHANGIEPSPWDYVRLTKTAENNYIGLNNGILDQTSIVFGRAGHLLHIDTRKPGVDALAAPGNTPAFRILVAYSGYSRELTTTGYNTRVAECREAAATLAALGGHPETRLLMDIPKATFDAHGRRLPGPLFRRARHFFSEVERVARGIEAWRSGTMETFGQLMCESCRSSMEDYECGIPPVHDLQKIVSRTEGVFGSRFSGGGFGGCVIGFVAAECAEEAARHIQKTYRQRHADAAHQAKVFLAHSQAGLGGP